MSTSTNNIANSTAVSTLTSIGTSAASSNSLSSSLAVSGIASGMNWQNTVLQLANAERAPEKLWQKQQFAISAQNAAYGTISSNMASLQTSATTLMSPAFFNSRVSSSSSPSVASATAVTGATVGNFNFNITQLATASQMNGASGISQALDPQGNPAAVTIGTAGFSTPVTAGTFTVNGAQITLNTTDSLQTVFNNITSATGNNVMASYDPTADKITLVSSDGSPIVLGSATDTSNFLQTTQLYSNNSGVVSSATTLGRVNTRIGMTQSELLTPITDGGSGNGAFTINGVTIHHNASNDSIQNVLDRINQSGAGVTAAYDSVNNRFTLTNNTTGNVGISMQDVTGNFLAATGIAGGTLNQGQNLTYTLNGGSQALQSQSNTISSASSGITGLSVTALNTGTTSVSVAPDTNTISTAIQQFVSDYNATQRFIASQQSVTTAANGTVTPGVLTADPHTNAIASALRSLMTQVTKISGTAGAVKSLSDLGFQTNGKDNTISLSNNAALTSALANHLSDVSALFATAASGLGTQLNNYVTNTTGANGTLTAHGATLTKQSATISTQIANLENKIAADSANLTTEFQNMETATARTNQQLTFLSRSIASGSL